MTKKKKLVKEALEHPELYSDGDLAFFQLWLNTRKINKERKKQEKLTKLETMYEQGE